MIACDTENMDFADKNSLREKDLERQIEIKNAKISSLEKNLKEMSVKLSQQETKYQNACEAREEFRFTVSSLEGERKTLKSEIEKLRIVIQDQKDSKSAREISLEALVASYEDMMKTNVGATKIKPEKTPAVSSTDTDEIPASSGHKTPDKLNESTEQITDLKITLSNYKEKLQSQESKIAQLQSEKNERTALFQSQECKIAQLESEKNELTSSSINKQNDLANLKDSLKKCEEILEEEKIITASLLARLKNKGLEHISSGSEKADTEGRVLQVQNQFQNTSENIHKDLLEFISNFPDQVRKVIEETLKKTLRAEDTPMVQMEDVQKGKTTKRISSEKGPNESVKKSRLKKRKVLQETSKENISKASTLKEPSKRNKEPATPSASSSQTRITPVVTPAEKSEGKNAEKGRAKRELRPRKIPQ